MTVVTVIAAIVAVAAALGVFVLILLRDVASDLAKQEARAWLPRLSRKIVRQAAESLPVDQRGILEDMESQLSERSDRPVTMLLFAMRVARDRRLIAAEARELALEASEIAPRGSTVSVGRPLAGAIGAIKQAVTAVRSGVNRVRSGVNLAPMLAVTWYQLRYLLKNRPPHFWVQSMSRLMTLLMSVVIIGVQIGFIHGVSLAFMWRWISGLTIPTVTGIVVAVLLLRLMYGRQIRLLLRGNHHNRKR
jgi:hypothetical protein